MNHLEAKPTSSELEKLKRRQLNQLLALFGLPFLWGTLAYLTRDIQGALIFFTLITAPPVAGLLGYIAGRKKIAALAVKALVLSLSVSLWPFTFLYLIFGFLLSGPLSAAGVELREQYAPPEAEETAEESLPDEVSRQDLLNALMILQAELENQKQRQAFLSVDIVGSTEMVTRSPEHEAEYSFLRFRTWVEGVVKGNGGEITSSAGDGILCRFTDDMKAVQTALSLQQEIARFNREQNRLPMPFRIRCGVSAGDAAIGEGTQLSEVQSPAIYRAAMLQKQAEPGGIVVGEEISSDARLELGPVVPLLSEAEGRRAYACRSSAQTLSE